MKKMVLIGFVILFLAPIAFSQERIDNPPEYKVGDTWKWKWTKGREGHSWSNKVIEVKENEIVAETGRKNILFLDRQYNVLKVINPKGEDVTHNFWWERWFWFKEFPLYYGKKWNQTQKGGFFDFTRGIRFEQDYDISYEVEGFEKVSVRAGAFNAARIRMTLLTEDETGRGKITLKVNLWYSPEVKNYVKGEWPFSWHWMPAWRDVAFQLIKFEPAK